jgi:site-specific DNA-methyltransferase (adenine-specific)
MKSIPDRSVDMILCDLPYGTTACKWDTIIPFEPLWEQYNRIIKDESAVVLFGSEPFSSYLRMSNIKSFKYDLVWQKSKSGSAFTAKYRPVNKHEMISVFSKGGKKTKYNPQMTKGEPYKRTHKISEVDINNHQIGFNRKEVVSVNEGYRYPITILDFPQKWRRQDQVHPTQKPVELLEWLIKSYTNEGELVLDNCMGSGSTGVACLNTNRKFIGIELDEGYFNIAKKRIDETRNEHLQIC